MAIRTSRLSVTRNILRTRIMSLWKAPTATAVTVCKPDYVSELAAVIQKTFDRGGNLVIPSFAVGRTQELLYFMRIIKEKKLVQGHGNFTVYVDSPLAIEATNIFNENSRGYYDEEAAELVNNHINPIAFAGLKTSVTSEDSKMINADKQPKVIISASGMCDAGRIKHHLKHNLWRRECTVLFVGYQAAGTLGRAIIDGARQVKLFGEEVTGTCGDTHARGYQRPCGQRRAHALDQQFFAPAAARICYARAGGSVRFFCRQTERRIID